MFFDQLLLIMLILVELIIGKSLLIPGQKIKSKLVSLLLRILILIVHSVTMFSALLIMVLILFDSGLGQLRHNSNASGPSYGKRFKK